MQSAILALEELLVTAQKQHCLTVGIYESAKLLNAWVEPISYGLSRRYRVYQLYLLFSQSKARDFHTLTAANIWAQVCVCSLMFLFVSLEIPTAWSCAFWQLTMRRTWRCRSTSPCCSPFAATAASTSCGSLGLKGCGSFWEVWMPTETRRRAQTSTACWSRWVWCWALWKCLTVWRSDSLIKMHFYCFHAESSGRPL